CLNWYLPASREMGRVAHKMSPRRGFTFIEPVDKQLQTWNPLRTKPVRIAGNNKVEIYGEAPVRQVPVKVRDASGAVIRGHDMQRFAGRPGGMRKGDSLQGTFMGIRLVPVPGHKPKP